MTTPEQRLDRLETIDTIRRIPQQFARAIDERDIDEWRIVHRTSDILWIT